MKEKLELLANAKKFNIIRTKDYRVSGNEYYRVELIDGIMIANIFDDGEIEYCITGCYDYGEDEVAINMEELKELQNFCKLLIGKEEKKNNE